MSEQVKKTPARPTPPPSPVKETVEESTLVVTNEPKLEEVTESTQEIQKEQKMVKAKKEKASKSPKLPEEKIKREKTPKEKKERKKVHIGKIGIIIIIASVLLVALLATGMGLYIKHINTKLATPTFVINQSQISTIIEIDKVDDAYGYEVYVSQGGAEGNTFKISTNVVELKSYLNAPGVFTLKVRALGKTDNATSDYSGEQTITNFATIDTPMVFRDENILSWNPISHASGYRVYYRANLSSGEVDFVELSQGISTLTFDLTSLNENGPALYPVCVQAIAPSEGYYLSSGYSDTFNYEYYAQAQEPFNATYDNASKILKFRVYANSYYSNKYSVALTTQNFNLVTHDIFVDDVSKTMDVYLGKQIIEFTVDFTEIVNENVINATITTLPDSEYSIGCDAIEITVD